jgi:hypothetical protein
MSLRCKRQNDIFYAGWGIKEKIGRLFERKIIISDLTSD